jgi:hypothetical protein
MAMPFRPPYYKAIKGLSSYSWTREQMLPRKAAGISSDKSIVFPVEGTSGYLESQCVPYAFQGFLDCKYLSVGGSA